jgi:phi13 family phage major tail protein
MADSNKIKYGLKNCKYAVATIASDGSATYAAPKDLPGAVSISLSAEGDTTPFYADNITYYVSVANNGYSGDLELARIPEDFLKDCLGYAVGGNNLVYEDAGAEPVHFALLFQFEGDASARRHVLYNCVATRPELASQTKGESIEPQTETLSITATTIYVAAIDKDVVKSYLNEGDTGYTTFLSTVAQPTA